MPTGRVSGSKAIVPPAGSADRTSVVWTTARSDADEPKSNSAVVVPTPHAETAPETVTLQLTADADAPESFVEASTMNEFVAVHAVSGVGASLTALKA